MDFVTGLLKNIDWQIVEYDLILIIVNQFTKMVYYKPIFTILNAEQLAEILIETVIKYHGLSDSIITDKGLLFTLKFWSSFCYYLNVKH